MIQNSNVQQRDFFNQPRKVSFQKSEVEKQMQLFSSVVEQTADMVLVTDQDGVIEYVNPSFEKMTGYSKKEVIGLTPKILKSGQNNPQIYKILWNTILSGQTFNAVLINKKKNGELFYTEKTISPLFDDSNQVQHFVSTDRDVTEQKKAEESLEKKAIALERANAELEQFTNIASHDLREPLRTITTYLQLIERKNAKTLDQESLGYMNFTIDAAKRMRDLIDDLLSYSKIGREKLVLQKTNCNDILNNIKANLQTTITEKGAEITSEELPVINADPSFLSQLLQNLIANALKYSNGRKPNIQIKAEPSDGNWLFSVKDNGIGITRESYERIFKMFKRLHSTSEYTGTGIGLAICKKIVEEHGGRIWLESTVGEGSTFYFTMPS
ncbi:MAG: ATP-binding protein [Oligoflexia bacterium]|nr:ATP-binding protein [Oligoflexia bacterium]